MKPEDAYQIIDQLIGMVSVNREVGMKRDEAMKEFAKLVPVAEEKEDG